VGDTDSKADADDVDTVNDVDAVDGAWNSSVVIVVWPSQDTFHVLTYKIQASSGILSARSNQLKRVQLWRDQQIKNIKLSKQKSPL